MMRSAELDRVADTGRARRRLPAPRSSIAWTSARLGRSRASSTGKNGDGKVEAFSRSRVEEV